MQKNKESIKCPKCGFENALGSKKCVKCNKEFDFKKSCPKCAKRNDIEAETCINCGFNFNKKRSKVLVNLILCILLVVVLCLLVYFEYSKTVDNIKIGLRILAIVLILITIYHTFNYGRKDIKKFNAEEEFVDNKNFDRLRMISNIAVILGTIGVVAFLIYYYFWR